MKAEDIPPELVAILDNRAGKAHSPEGTVLQTLAEILTEYDRIYPYQMVYDERNELAQRVGQLEEMMADTLLSQSHEAVWDRHYEAPSLEDEAAVSLDPPPVSMPSDEVRPGRVL